MSTEMSAGGERPRVCRRLFSEMEENEIGIVDNFRNQCLDKLRQDQEAAKKKWNFDFATETPLEGRWEWKKVEDDAVSEPSSGENEVVVQNNRANSELSERPVPQSQPTPELLNTDSTPIR